jgi:hypothetical protein
VLIINHVSIPTLTLYKPAKPLPLHSAVIICPVGGYGILAAGHEGFDVAEVLSSWGITAFVLKYRLPDNAIILMKCRLLHKHAGILSACCQ